MLELLLLVMRLEMELSELGLLLGLGDWGDTAAIVWTRGRVTLDAVEVKPVVDADAVAISWSACLDCKNSSGIGFEFCYDSLIQLETLI